VSTSAPLIREADAPALAIAPTQGTLETVPTLAPVVTSLKAMHDDHVPMGLMAAWRFRPALAWAAVVGGVFEVGLGSITTAHGSGIGLDLAMATSIAGAMGMGSFVLQYPLGWLADHLPARRLFAIGAAALVLSAVAFVQSTHQPSLLWVCAALWGGIGGARHARPLTRRAPGLSAPCAPRRSAW